MLTVYDVVIKIALDINKILEFNYIKNWNQSKKPFDLEDRKMTKKGIFAFIALTAVAICLTASAAQVSPFQGTYKGAWLRDNSVRAVDMTLSIQDEGAGKFSAWASLLNELRQAGFTRQTGTISNIKVDGNQMIFTLIYGGGVNRIIGTNATYTLTLTGDKITGNVVNNVNGNKATVNLTRLQFKACPIDINKVITTVC